VDQCDVVIIGAGPAGLAAGVYCARKILRTLVVSKDVGGQAAWSWEVENYLGYQLITGAELVEHFYEHIKSFDVELREKVEVSSLEVGEDAFTVTTDKGEYRAPAVIVASGKVPRLLNVPGEREFRGRGVAYCATCDGPLFAHKDVAVVGSGNAGLDAALQLSRIARHIYLINAEQKCTGDEATRELVLKAENIQLLHDTRVKEITGEVFVKSLKVEDLDGGKEEELPVSGVFIEIGSIPSTSFLSGVIELNQAGEIPIDSNNRTSVPGIFAAGDVTDVIEKQIIIAAGEGAKAALSAYAYLQH
jgi:alkyl hydroperoxide reductase subunit F